MNRYFLEAHDLDVLLRATSGTPTENVLRKAIALVDDTLRAGQNESRRFAVVLNQEAVENVREQLLRMFGAEGLDATGEPNVIGRDLERLVDLLGPAPGD